MDLGGHWGGLGVFFEGSFEGCSGGVPGVFRTYFKMFRGLGMSKNGLVHGVVYAMQTPERDRSRWFEY